MYVKMGQPLDPLSLLQALSPMLDVTGAVIGVDEMRNIVKLMKDSTKLVSRCVYLNILRVTESSEVLEHFLAQGGWEVMNAWLADAKSSENMALILEVMKLLQRLPLRIEHLKQNNTPKIVKSLAKTAQCQKVKSTASTLMTSWLNIIRSASTNPAGSKPKKESNKVKPKLDKIPKKEKKDDKKVPVVRAPSFAKIRKTGLEEGETKKGQPKKANNKRSSVDSEDTVPDKKIKTEPKQPKKITISAGFMDALNSVATPAVVKRPVKRRLTKPTKSNPAGDKMSPSHSMAISGEAGDFGEAMDHDRTPSPTPPPTPSKPRLNKWGKPMKSVRWVQDSHIEDIRYFECEEGERVNVTSQGFKDAMQRDRLSERERLGDFHHKGEGGWIKPSLIDLPAPLVESGSNSVEKDIQKEREKTVLQEIFLSIDMVPDSPAEPDPEPYEMIPPKIIPTDDPNDPGPNAERSPSPINGDNVVLKNMLNNVMGNPQPQPTTPDLKDKLREILQAANANTASNGNTAIQEEQPPQNPQFQPPMQNGVDPNMMYPPPNMMNGGFYPMVPPPGMGGPNIPPPNMMGNEQYPMEWRGPPPQMGPRMGPQRPFPPQYAPNESWRPRKPWGGRRGGGEFRGRWQGDRGRYRR